MTIPATQDRRPLPDEVSLVAIGNAVLAHRRLVVWCVLALVAAAVVVSLLRHRVYTAGATFFPQTTQPASGLSGVAAQLGVALPAVDAAQTPEFYVSLARSREILGTIALRSFTFRTDTGTFTGALLDAFHVTGRDSADRREAGIRALGAVVQASTDKRTQAVHVTATTRWPSLSVQVVSAILDLVNEFNIERRQGRAGAERRFTEQRLGEVKADLRAAEDRLQDFLEHNRNYRDSPILVFQEERLARDVSTQQQVYLTIAQAYEQAKIEEVRDTPVITVMERPEEPARPDPRGLVRRSLLALAVGLLLGIGLAVGLTRLSAARSEEAGAYTQFAVLRAATLADLRRPWRLLGPAAPTEPGSGRRT
jgi:uncharacterized protein involved in exopolysaccharide biosynthesis